MSKKKVQSILWGIGICTVLIGGVIFIPGLMKKYTKKVYQLGNREIDIESMGPEIVKKEA